MKLNHVAIATLTWARNIEEEQLLVSSLEQLAKQGLPVYITDAGSSESFLDFLEGNKNFILTKNIRGVWPQAQHSLQAAGQNHAYIFYTEPDKEGFFTNALDSFLGTVEVDLNTGVVLASRSASAFASFPAFQQITEKTINQCCAEVIGLEMDYVYGPFLMNAKLVGELQALPPDIGWGWRPFTFNTAKLCGLKVTHREGDFLCPEQQQKDDGLERVYRMKQMVQNIQGLILSQK
jgi:hypothetical protein